MEPHAPTSPLPATAVALLLLSAGLLTPLDYEASSSCQHTANNPVAHCHPNPLRHRRHRP